MLRRAATVLVVMPLFLAALFLLPPRYWMLVLLTLLGIGAWEWCGLAGIHGAGRALFLTLVLGCALAWLAAWPVARGLAQGIAAASVAFWCLPAPAWLALKWQIANRWLLAAIGSIVLLPTWLALAWLQENPLELLLLLGVIWVSDTAAYLSGRRYGRHRLAALISPGKTWEGVAGAAAAVAVYWLLIWFIVPSADSALGGVAGAGVALAMVMLGIEGDLFESWLKRCAGVKDSGRVFPGHGGVLDRIDSLTAAMPAALFALTLLR